MNAHNHIAYTIRIKMIKTRHWYKFYLWPRSVKVINPRRTCIKATHKHAFFFFWQLTCFYFCKPGWSEQPLTMVACKTNLIFKTHQCLVVHCSLFKRQGFSLCSHSWPKAYLNQSPKAYQLWVRYLPVINSRKWISLRIYVAMKIKGLPFLSK